MKRSSAIASYLLVLLLLLTWPFSIEASVTIVGNGDDGGDLEGGRKVVSGILIETRDKALAHLRRLNVQAVENLGTLLPELERSEIYLVERDLPPKLHEDHGMESSSDGTKVYARTFAEPHAATRFFASALLLNEEQLMALHIHEALHRSLPPSVRENEEVVTKITLSLTAPDSNIDRVRKIVTLEIPSETTTSQAHTSPRSTEDSVAGTNSITRAKVMPSNQTASRPSSLTYGYRSFFIPKEELSSYPIDSLHTLQSLLYPFGNDRSALGLGIELGYVRTPEESYLGPIHLSTRVRIASMQDFDIGLWGDVALNTLSSEELKHAPIGRNIATLGLSLRRETSFSYIENLLSYSTAGEAKQRVGKVEYLHEFGAILGASIRAGLKWKNLELGGFTEVLLSDSYVVKGGAFHFDSGNYSIISAGPELAYNKDAFRFAVTTRWVLDSTRGVSLDYLGDLMGRGAGQGFIGSSASLRF